MDLIAFRSGMLCDVEPQQQVSNSARNSKGLEDKEPKPEDAGLSN